jgi:hypothetical protein
MSTKIEDGFEMPSNGTPSIRPVAQCSSMTPTMILAVIAIVLFAGGLGFVGGMQINKSPQSNAVSGVPSGPVQQQTNPSTNNTTTPQGMPSSSNNNQQAGPQTNAGTSNTNMNNS